jgi:hypothetical protein
MGGGRVWHEVNLAVFNIYIDDSGTAPSQRIAIASALIIPASRILLLESEWSRFLDKYGITGFHSSECAFVNPKSEYANWPDDKVTGAFDRVTQITKKYGVRAFSYAVKKSDYDELMPERWKDIGGHKHYTWACKHVLNLIRRWRAQTDPSAPIEYFFDWQEGEPKQEIEEMMRIEEVLRNGEYEGHYAFKKRKDIPALQCTDLIAWTSLCAARLFFEGTPVNKYADRIRRDLATYRNQTWITSASVSRDNLRESIRKFLVDTQRDEEMKREWYAAHAHEIQ